MGVIQPGQRLPLGLEAPQNFGGGEAALDDLDGDHAPHARDLLRPPHDAHAAFANSLHQPVAFEQKALLLLLVAAGLQRVGHPPAVDRPAQERTRGLVRRKQFLHRAAQDGIATALRRHKRPPLAVVEFERRVENLLGARGGGIVHGLNKGASVG